MIPRNQELEKQQEDLLNRYKKTATGADKEKIGTDLRTIDKEHADVQEKIKVLATIPVLPGEPGGEQPSIIPVEPAKTGAKTLEELVKKNFASGLREYYPTGDLAKATTSEARVKIIQDTVSKLPASALTSPDDALKQFKTIYGTIDAMSKKNQLDPNSTEYKTMMSQVQSALLTIAKE